MRLFRAGLTFLMLMLGQDAITPLNIVQFIQTRRRKLRALKYQGLKVIRSKCHVGKEGGKQGLLQRIMSLPANMICSRESTVEHTERIVIGQKKSEVIEVFNYSCVTSFYVFAH